MGENKKKLYLFDLWSDFAHFSINYVKFDADYDFDRFKVGFVFVCLFLTRRRPCEDNGQ